LVFEQLNAHCCTVHCCRLLQLSTEYNIIKTIDRKKNKNTFKTLTYAATEILKYWSAKQTYTNHSDRLIMLSAYPLLFIIYY